MSELEAQWANAVERFRGNDTPERAVLLQGNPMLQRLCVAWSNCGRVVKVWNIPQGMRRTLPWLSLWTAVEFDREELRLAADIPRHEFKRVWQVAQTNRLIFPDGSLSNSVQTVLRSMVLSAAGVRPQNPRPPVRPPQPPPATGQTPAPPTSAGSP